MTKDEKTKKGILKYVASTGAKGVKFEDEPDTWYNPATDQAREQVTADYIGKEVEVLIIPGKRTSFSSMVLIKQEKEHPLGAKVIKPNETLTDKGLAEVEGQVLEEEALDTMGELSQKDRDDIAYAELQTLESEKGYPAGPAPGEEEKVLPQTPSPKEEEAPPSDANLAKQEGAETGPCDEKKTDEDSEEVVIEADIKDFGNEQFFLQMVKQGLTQEYTQRVYSEMKKVQLETSKKGTKATYISWTEAWDGLKKLHPTATYHVSENKVTGMPYVSDKTGAFVKVSVTVLEITHTVHLPVMDHFNKAIKEDALDTFAINKSIMRAFAKAIAMHGMGIYVFKGEDYPEETKK